MKWKTVIGVILVIISIACMFLWESTWRDKLTLVNIYVAAKDIEQGETADESCFKLAAVTKNMLSEDSIKESDKDKLASLLGLECLYPVYKNEPVNANRFGSISQEPEDYRKKVMLPLDWFYVQSEVPLAGDIVDFYTLPEKEYTGSYEIIGTDNNNLVIMAEQADYFKLYDIHLELGDRCFLPILSYESSDAARVIRDE